MSHTIPFGASGPGSVTIGCPAVVAGPVAALVAVEGLEGASGDVGSGESTVPARGFLPCLAAKDTAGTIARLLMTSSQSGASHELELLPWSCTGWAWEGASK